MEVYKERFKGITLEIAEKKLEMWLEAEDALATSQSYKIGSRTLTRVDLSQVREAIEYWASKVDALKNGDGRRRVVRGFCVDR